MPNPIGCDCSDVEVRNDFDGPRSEFTCLQQVEYGNCEQDFMLHTIKEIPEGGSLQPLGWARGQSLPSCCARRHGMWACCCCRSAGCRSAAVCGCLSLQQDRFKCGCYLNVSDHAV